MRGLNLSAWAVAHRALVGFLIALIFAAGGLSYSRLGRNEDPNFTVKVLVVTALWPGATAQETQDLLAEPIERKLQDLAHLDNINTFARPGFVAALVTFRDDTAPADVPGLFYQTRKKLDDLRPSLPAGVLGPAVNDEYTDVYGAVFALTGADNAELTRQAEHVRDRLLRVPGTEKVTILGEIPRSIDVEFSHARLAALGVTVPQIAQRHRRTERGDRCRHRRDRRDARAAARRWRAARRRTASPRCRCRPAAPRCGSATSPTSIAATRTRRNSPCATTAQPGVVVAVSTQAGVNRLAFGDALRAEAQRLRADLPAGITLQQIADQPSVIGEAVGEFVLKFCVALGVVLVVSFLSLGWRTGIVVALAVPLTLALVFVVMDLLGIELQRVSLGALIISLGLLVDDAIIAVETMVVKLEEGWDRVKAATFAWQSTAFPMLTGTLVTAAGFLPVGLARSTTGEYAGGIFWVVTVALLASWVVAVIFTPYLGVLLLPTPKRRVSHDAIYATRPYRALRRVVAFAVRRRRSVVLATVALFALSVGGMGLVRQQFFPSSARPELIVDVTLRQGASHAATEAAVQQIETALAKDADVRWYTSYVGGGPPRFFLAFNPALPNDAVATIVLTTRDAEARERVRARLMAFVAERRRAVGTGARVAAGTRPAGRLPGAVPRRRRRSRRGAPRRRSGAGRAARDTGHARRATGLGRAGAVGAAGTRSGAGAATRAGAAGRGADAGDAGVRHDRDADPRPHQADRRGAARRAGRAARSRPAARSGACRPRRGRCRWRRWRGCAPQTEEPILWRRDREPYLTVQADIQDGLQAPDVTAAALPRIRALDLPAGVRVDVGGAAEESAKANTALIAVFPVMVGAMLLLLMVQLQNLPRVLLVLATMPLGVIGAVAALLAADAPFGFVALLGVIALGGMIMRNTIILVDQVRQDQESGLALREAIIESTVRRSRPVVLTALAAALAFVPLSFNVFWGPMALAMIGGLLVATVLTLLFLPALYALAFRVREGGAAHIAAPAHAVAAR